MALTLHKSMTIISIVVIIIIIIIIIAIIVITITIIIINIIIIMPRLSGSRRSRAACRNPTPIC